MLNAERGDADEWTRASRSLLTRLLYCTMLRRRAIFRSARALCSATHADRPVRVRFAPSPTGSVHLGGLRTALFNYLFAKKHGGQFLIRIEDTDKTREVEGSIQELLAMLDWAGVPHDEGPDRIGDVGPYTQSQRLDIYHEHAKELTEKGRAYPCFCTPERLASLRESQAKRGAGSMYDRACAGLDPRESAARIAAGEQHVIRLKVLDQVSGSSKLQDVVRGTVTFPHGQVDDQILVKTDGYPTYHFASVVDDHLMGITHVIRGEEWLPSYPKHELLYSAFGWDMPHFAHLPLLLNADKTKLSKRKGDVSIQFHKNAGYLPSAMLNFVALLGWNPGSGSTQEVFTHDQLVEQFELHQVNKGGAVVDRQRLDWINAQHIRTLLHDDADAQMRVDTLSKGKEVISAHLAHRAGAGTDAQEEGGIVVSTYSDDYIWAVMRLMRERVHVLRDFGPLCYYFFVPPDFTTEEAKNFKNKVWKDDHKDILCAVSTALEAEAVCSEGAVVSYPDPAFTEHDVKDIIKSIMKQRDVKMKNVLLPLRLALTGMNVGADMGKTIELVGRQRTIERINTFLSTV